MEELITKTDWSRFCALVENSIQGDFLRNLRISSLTILKNPFDPRKDKRIFAPFLEAVSVFVKESIYLKKIVLFGTTADVASALCQALTQNTSTLQDIRLVINGNLFSLFGSSISRTIRNCLRLQKLTLAVCGMGDDGVATLAEALKHSQTLNVLEVMGNYIGPEGAAEFASLLKSNSTLEIFDISYNKIGDKGVTGIADALKQNFTLKEVELGYNRCGKAGYLAVANALKHNSTLTSVRIFPGSTDISLGVRRNQLLRVIDDHSSRLSCLEASIQRLALASYLTKWGRLPFAECSFLCLQRQVKMLIG